MPEKLKIIIRKSKFHNNCRTDILIVRQQE